MKEAEQALIKYRLERSAETLEEARAMAKMEHWNTCVNRLYYACFYAVSALLLTKGLSSARHSGIRALFNVHFVQAGSVSRDLADFYNDLFEHRQESDYEDFFRADAATVLPWIEQAENFVKAVTRLIT